MHHVMYSGIPFNYSQGYLCVFVFLTVHDTMACQALYLMTVLSVVFKASTAAKPHLMFMLVDDWGWGNVGYHRNESDKEVVTPNSDALVKEGLELDQHYVYQFYSPSRSCLMSGRLPIHVNDRNAEPNVYNPEDKEAGFAGIPRHMTGITEN